MAAARRTSCSPVGGCRMRQSRRVAVMRVTPSLPEFHLTPFVVASAGFGLAIGMAVTAQQQDMFSAGEAYERFMGRWSGLLAPALVRFAQVREGARVLDIGSGTGSLAASVASSAPTSQITGIDPAESYVRFANTRHGSGRVRFEVGDAQRLGFEENSFDVVLSMLVLNFIPDRDRAVDEMIRVARPGGVVAAAVWDYGAGMEMLRVFWDEAVALRPEDTARDERHMPLCREGELAAFWRKHGLRDLSEQALEVRTRFDSFEDYWTPFLEKQGPAGAYVAQLSDTAREALRLRLRTRLLGEGPDREFTLTARAWAVRGTAPR